MRPVLGAALEDKESAGELVKTLKTLNQCAQCLSVASVILVAIHWRKRFAITRGNGREESRNREDRPSRPSLRLVRARSAGIKGDATT